nr:YetF domain-containing protein [Paenibacillus dendrobii]
MRSIVGFVFLIIAAKMMGQRSISGLRFLDFIIALTLGNIIAHPLSDEHLGLKGSIISTFSIVFLYITAIWLSLKIPLLKQFFDPPAITLVLDGKIDYRNLSKAKLSIQFLYAELRKSNVEDIAKVAFAAWEPGGTLSVFLNTAYQPITPTDLKLSTQPFNLTKPIITDGHMEHALLNEIGKDGVWLETEIQPHELNNVLLATVDSKLTVQVHIVRKTKLEENHL